MDTGRESTVGNRLRKGIVKGSRSLTKDLERHSQRTGLLQVVVNRTVLLRSAWQLPSDFSKPVFWKRSVDMSVGR